MDALLNYTTPPVFSKSFFLSGGKVYSFLSFFLPQRREVKLPVAS